MKRGEMDSYEVGKIVIFLIAVGVFWYLFTLERDINRGLNKTVSDLQIKVTKMETDQAAQKTTTELRFSEWTKNMMDRTTGMDLVKKECADLVTQCKLLAQEQEHLKKAPRPQKISVKIENVPVDFLPKSAVKSQVEQAAKNMKRGKLK